MQERKKIERVLKSINKRKFGDKRSKLNKEFL